MTPDEAHDYAMVTGARIEEDIKWKGQVWEDFSLEERLVAASATPTALHAELQAQLREAIDDEPGEYACKAAAKRKTKPPNTDTAKPENKPDVVTLEVLKGAPSMWKSGTVKCKRPSTLCVPAASVLMGMLYWARMARYDLLRPVQSLATYHYTGW